MKNKIYVAKLRAKSRHGEKCTSDCSPDLSVLNGLRNIAIEHPNVGARGDYEYTGSGFIGEAFFLLYHNGLVGCHWLMRQPYEHDTRQFDTLKIQSQDDQLPPELEEIINKYKFQIERE